VASVSAVKPERVSLKDVARHAGVSTGTVSMVLNAKPSVAAKTRTHVQQVIDELGYVYDRSGAQLRSRRTGIVGVSICNLANPYFAEITVGIDEALGELRLSQVLGHCGESVVQQAKFLNTAREHNVEGLVVMPAVGTPHRLIEDILAWHIPVVLVSRYVAGTATDYAGLDNHAGSLLATEHLLALGHERIAYVGANARTSTGRDRLRGYRSALRAAGTAPIPDLVCHCDATREQGYIEAMALMAHRERPTAIVCFNDLVAFGVMLGLRKLGLEPGRDCSVVGADDVAEAALWQPGLTTVAGHPGMIGLAAGRLLRQRLAAPARPPERILLQPELVVRGSSGPRLKSGLRQTPS
jgi:LacI family transcriptional regulator